MPPDAATDATLDKSVDTKDKVSEGAKHAQAETDNTGDRKAATTKEQERIEKSTSVAALEIKKDDGATVSLNDKGQVAQVTDGKGHSRKFEYDQKGDLNGGTSPDGQHWTTKDGTHWTSDKGHTLDGTFKVSKDGNLSFTDAHGTAVLKTDGSVEFVNDKNQVAAVVDAKGIPRSFQYDEKGNVVGSKGLDGHWTTKDGKHWTDEKGHALEGTVKVNKDGSWSFTDAQGAHQKNTDGTWSGGPPEVDRSEAQHKQEQADSHSATDRKPAEPTTPPADKQQRAEHTEPSGDHKRTEHAEPTGTHKKAEPLSDGEHKKSDGSVVTAEKGHVTKVVDANHVTREFTYDDKGQISTFKDERGTWSSKDGTHWTSDKDEDWHGQVAVKPDGTFVTQDAKGLAFHQTDGKTAIENKTGGAHLIDRSGKVVETIDAAGKHLKFGYGADGKLNSVDDNGTKWDTKDGQHWTTKDGKSFDGTMSVDKDGAYKSVDSKGNETTKSADGTKHVKEADGHETLEGKDGKAQELHKAVDRNEMEKTAEAIRKATGNDNYVARWADKDKINDLLKDKTEAERKTIDELYKQKYGKNLDDEMSFLKGSDRDKFENILHKKDNDVGSQDAGRIGERLSQEHNWTGDNQKVIEKDIRDTLSKHNSEDLAHMDEEYRKTHNGQSLKDAILKDDKLSQSTKDMAAILLKGNDKMTDQDTLKLADIALKDKDVDKFSEAFRNASPEARKMFQDQGGEQKMKDAFEGHWYNAFKYVDVGGWATGQYGNVTDQELHHAEDFAQKGELSLKTQISDNTGIAHFTTNQKAIEDSISSMSDQDRKNYTAGKAIAEGRDPGKLSADERKAASDYYKETHDAITKAANDSEVSKWEDQIANKGGGLVSDIAAHHGTIYNDARGEVLKDIQNMDAKQWDYAKKHPENRAEVEKALQSLKGSRVDQADIDKAMAMYDEKMKAGSFEDSKKVGNRSLDDAIADDTHMFGNDRKDLVDSISHMSPDEQKRYRENTDGYHDKLDKELKDTIKDGPALDAARHMLNQVMEGKQPEMDLITKLNMHAQEKQESDTKYAVGAAVLSPATILMDSPENAGAARDKLFGSRSGEVIRDMQEAFNKDPKLRERIQHPTTFEDKQLSAEYHNAMQKAMSADDYEKYAKPLLETGHLPIDKQLELDQSLLHNDKQQVFKDLANASEDDKKRLLTDKDYQEKTLGFLSAEDRKVALASLDQKDGIHSEDTIRSYLNHWGGSSDIMTALEGVKPEDMAQVKRDYAAKYGSDMESDLLDKLGGDDKAKALRLLHANLSDDEKFNEARDEYYKSRQGVGSWFADNIGHSGTGYQADNAILQYQKEVTAANSQFDKITPEQTKELQEKFHTSLEDFKESKSAAADYVVNGTIAVGAIASLIATGGADAPLLVAMAAGGAALKVGAKAALMGNDYDMSMGQVGVDALTGAVDGFTAVLGPGEVAAIFKVGETAGVEAAELTVKQLGEQGAKELLKEGGQETLQNGSKELMRETLASGAKKVDEKAIEKLASDSIRPAGEGFSQEARAKSVQELSDNLKKNLTESMTQQTKGWLTNMAREGALNSGGGAMGGGAAGFTGSVAQWDPTKSFDENMRNVGQATVFSAASGAAMAGTFTLGLKGLGHAYEGVQGLSREAPHVGGGADVRVPETPRVQPNLETPHVQAVADAGHPEVVKPDIQANPQQQRVAFETPKGDAGGEVKTPKGDAGAEVKKPAADAGAEVKKPAADAGGEVKKPAADAGGEVKKPAADAGGEVKVPKSGRGREETLPKAEPVDDASVHKTIINREVKIPRAEKPALQDHDFDVRPGDKPGVLEWAKQKMGIGEKPAQNPYVPPTTAPRETGGLAVEGKALEPNKPVILGREGDVQVDGQPVSRRHAEMRVDEKGNTYIKDLDSTYGTFVNGKRITAESGEVRLKPGDKVTLGTKEISWGKQLEPTYQANIGGRDIQLKAGQEVPLTSQKLGGDYGRLGMDEKGMYVIAGNTKPGEGAFLNGKPLAVGEKQYLKPSDDLVVGSLKRVHGQDQSEHVSLLPKEVLRQRPSDVPSDPVEFRKAIEQSNDYAYQHQISDKLKDGWSNAGQHQEFGAGGEQVAQDAWRPSTVVDREHDPVLRAVIAEAKEKFGNLPPRERAIALNDYVNKLMKPDGMSEASLDKWYDAFNHDHPGERVYLGEFIREGKGVCSQQATLMKVLGDELDLKTTLVRGTGDPSNPTALNHAWTHIDLPGEQEPLIFDPRWKEAGGKYGDVPAHIPGAVVEKVNLNEATPLKFDTPRPPAAVVVDGKPLDIPRSGEPVVIGRGRAGTVDATAPDYAMVSANHAKLTRGEDGRLFITDTSSNGTYVNGRRIPKDRPYPLSPSDVVRLGSESGPELKLGIEPSKPADILIKGKPFEVKPGEEIPIGRKYGMLNPKDTNFDLVSADHAVLHRDADGNLFIKDTSKNGTFVNGEQIPKGQEWPIGPNDKVTLGSENGPELQLTERAAAKPDIVKSDVAAATPEKPVSVGADGKVREVLDSAGRRQSFEYSADGRLEKVNYPNGVVAERVEGTNWKITDAGHDKGFYDWEGNIGVTKDGTVWSQAKGGDSVGTKLDGTKITHDRFGATRVQSPDGKVVNTTDVNGGISTYGYGQYGDLNRITFPNGQTATSADGKVWLINDLTHPNGSYDWHGQAAVDSDGTLHWKPTGGGETTIRADGSRVINEASGISRTESADGRILDTTNIRGKQTSFDYNSQGQLSKVTMGGGKSAESLDGKSWTVTDPSHPEGKYNWRGAASVEKDGTLRWKAEGGAETITRPDGVTVVNDRTGGSKVISPDGRITGTRDSNGSMLRYEYAQSGELSKITYPNGITAEAVLKPGEGTAKQWVITDATHPGGKYTWDGALKVDNDGTLWQKATGGDRIGTKLDGSSEIKDRFGGTIKMDGQSRITSTTDSNGLSRQFEYGQDGGLRSMTSSDGSRTASADGSHWTTRDKTGATREWTGKLQVDSDGTLRAQPDGRPEFVVKLNGSTAMKTDALAGTPNPAEVGAANPLAASDNRVAERSGPGGSDAPSGRAGDATPRTTSNDDVQVNQNSTPTEVTSSVRPEATDTTQVPPERSERPSSPERPEMSPDWKLPPLDHQRDDYSIQTRVPGYPKSAFRAELPSPGVVDVTDIFTRDMPKGSGSKLLAQSLKDFNAMPTKQLVIKNIENAETLAAFKAGLPPDQSLLGKTGTKALSELGITPKSYRWETVRGKLSLVIETE